MMSSEADSAGDTGPGWVVLGALPCSTLARNERRWGASETELVAFDSQTVEIQEQPGEEAGEHVLLKCAAKGG